jgi:hypothetical protein
VQKLVTKGKGAAPAARGAAPARKP